MHPNHCSVSRLATLIGLALVAACVIGCQSAQPRESAAEPREEPAQPPASASPANRAPPAATDSPSARSIEPQSTPAPAESRAAAIEPAAEEPARPPEPAVEPDRPAVQPAALESPPGTTILAVAGPSHPPAVTLEARPPRTLKLTTDNVQRMRLSRAALPLGDAPGSLVVHIDGSGIEFRDSFDWIIVERTVTGAWIIVERHPIHP